MTLYRSFDSPEHADDFANGKIFISTLQRCRASEDKVRQDCGEGSIIYHTGTFKGSDIGALRMASRRLGMDMDGDGVGEANLSNNTFYGLPADAFVLCLTRVIVPKFGQHMVRIDHPRLLFRAISKALGAFDDNDGEYGRMRSIQYRERVYANLERAPPIGFTKPTVPFAEEQEVTMLWPLVDSKRLEQGVVFCPEAVRYCTRLPLPSQVNPAPSVLRSMSNVEIT